MKSKQTASPISPTCVDAAAGTDAAGASALSPTNDSAGPPTYDPEDYRWVPVRRRPRADGWTEEKQRRFIETLADTGQVSLAAKEVGMSRESAYRLRRSAHGAAFARAWDAARWHSGSFLEDVAFERAIEGVEHNVYNEYGEVLCTKRVYNDRLLTFLLRHLKPERYARDALSRPEAAPPAALEASLREMEPRLPAPAEELLGPETLAYEIQVADIADGTLPRFLSEQRPKKSAERLKAEAIAAQDARGKAVSDRLEQGPADLTYQELGDMCRYMDPASRNEPPRKRFR